MCRYAMTKYKEHCACFNCRVTFKRKLLVDIGRQDKAPAKEAKCPNCGSVMANMGMDFEAPKKSDVRGWDHIKTLYSLGITFHSCGCTGPGYIPNTKDGLIGYFEEIRREYQRHLDFWRQREEPTDRPSIDRDRSKNWQFLGRIPYEARSEKETISNEDAKKYWIARLNEVNQKLNQLTM